MERKTEFTPYELDRIRVLLNKKYSVGLQNHENTELRKMGFYVSEFSSFLVDNKLDLDELLMIGAVKVGKTKYHGGLEGLKKENISLQNRNEISADNFNAKKINSFKKENSKIPYEYDYKKQKKYAQYLILAVCVVIIIVSIIPNNDEVNDKQKFTSYDNKSMVSPSGKAIYHDDPSLPPIKKRENGQDLSYKFQIADNIPPYKLSVDVTLSNYATFSEIENIAEIIYNEVGKKYDKIFISYYLAWETKGKIQAYATSHYNPNLEIYINE